MIVPQTTIQKHINSIYDPMAMLAAIKLDVFTPLAEGDKTVHEVADAVGVQATKLDPLLYALVNAELLTVNDGKFSNTPESAAYFVKGQSNYMGGIHELYSDLWSALLQTATSIKSGEPQAQHDFEAMTDEELGAFFRGLHAGALATGRQLAETNDFTTADSLVDVGGGSGGLAIAACETCPTLKATVVELSRVAKIARECVADAKMDDRINVIAQNVVDTPLAGSYDVAVLRYLLQVLPSGAAASALKHIGMALKQNARIFIIGHILDETRLAPLPAVGMGLVFLNLYSGGDAYTENEHRGWLNAAGFVEIDCLYGQGPNGATIITARKA